MPAIGFDNQKYLTTQSEQIKKRIAQFGGKLYLEFGGKLFDDYHASRVLPGFEPDSKIRMLQQLQDDVEILIAINAADIEKNKVRGDLGITYDDDVLRLIDIFRGMGFYVGGVVMTRYSGLGAASALLLNALKAVGGIGDQFELISAQVLEPVCRLKTQYLGHKNPRLHTDEVLMALTISALTNPLAELAQQQLPKLRGCDAHFTVILSEVDENLLRRLGINVSCEARYETKKLYHK